MKCAHGMHREARRLVAHPNPQCLRTSKMVCTPKHGRTLGLVGRLRRWTLLTPAYMHSTLAGAGRHPTPAAATAIHAWWVPSVLKAPQNAWLCE